MKLMGIFDWWSELLIFVNAKPENPFLEGNKK